MEELNLYSQIKTESAKGRTYGECVMDEISSIRMIDGEFRTTLHIKEKPKRLNREDALIYYTQKLRNVWARIG
ncbi:hypothetical protein [Sulfuricurvum sp.]|uniref:hypothetical protein n=1 Tax=Sulfuricurvum sp. TaxID=2025608 RepID=UPI003BB4AC8F